MSRQGWSLSGRMLRWLVLTSGSLAVVLVAVGAWFVHATSSREIDSLLQEELDEVRAAFPHTERDAAAFQRITAELNELHPANRFAWRVWQPDGEGLLGEFGARGLLRADAPGRDVLNRPVEIEGGFRWRSTELPTGHTIGLLVDEHPQYAILRSYAVIGALFLVATLVATGLVGRMFGAKLSQHLSAIARRARQVHASSESLEIGDEGLPEEVRVVVEALETMLRNIRQETQSSQLMIAGLAHELRSPIQNLIGESEVALLAERSNERYREVLDSNLDELRELGDAVNNLISLCSPQRSAGHGSVEEFDLLREARLRLEREEKLAARREIALDVVAEGDFAMRGDREAILTAVRNVASNAIEWSPPGGRVDVRFEGGADDISILVDDSGPGIPADLQRRIFEPFFRGPAATGRRVGYGLGLALTRKAIEAQAGRIEVERSPLGGARFRLTLPRDPGARPPEAAPDAA